MFLRDIVAQCALAAHSWSPRRTEKNGRSRSRAPECDQTYHRHHGALPVTLDALTTVEPTTGEPWLTDVPDDPWDSPYEYRVTNAAKREFTIVSSGRDRQEGTEDDVRYDSAAPRRRD